MTTKTDDKCKQCGACRTCDICACCGKCRECGKAAAVAPNVNPPTFIPMPYPVPQPYPHAPLPSPWWQDFTWCAVTPIDAAPCGTLAYNGCGPLLMNGNGGTYQ